MFVLSHRDPTCFTICLCISPDLDGHRAPKMKYWTHSTLDTQTDRQTDRSFITDSCQMTVDERLTKISEVEN
jgi:hypothetical protein